MKISLNENEKNRIINLYKKENKVQLNESLTYKVLQNAQNKFNIIQSQDNVNFSMSKKSDGSVAEYPTPDAANQAIKTMMSNQGAPGTTPLKPEKPELPNMQVQDTTLK
jgi:hypothetical protein